MKKRKKMNDKASSRVLSQKRGFTSENHSCGSFPPEFAFFVVEFWSEIQKKKKNKTNKKKQTKKKKEENERPRQGQGMEGGAGVS